MHRTPNEQLAKNLRPLFVVRVYRSVTTIGFVRYEKISGESGCVESNNENNTRFETQGLICAECEVLDFSSRYRVFIN